MVTYMNLPFVSRALPPPLVIKVPLLLAELCPVKAADLPASLVAQPLTLHAVKLAVVLKKIISPTGWRHGGIND